MTDPASLDRFARHIANEVARILREELEDTSLSIETRIGELDREIAGLRKQLVDLAQSHSHALEAQA